MTSERGGTTSPDIAERLARSRTRVGGGSSKELWPALVPERIARSHVRSDGALREGTIEAPPAAVPPGPTSGRRPGLGRRPARRPVRLQEDGAEATRVAADAWRPSLVMSDGRVVAWDPCTPIPYLLLRPGMPAGGAAAIGSVLNEVQGLSRYRFVAAGWVDGAPASTAALRGRALLGWVEPGQAPEFEIGEVDVAGTGGLSAVNGRPVGGFAFVRSTPGRTTRVDADAIDVLRHEVGHLLGLGHVDDARKVMYPIRRRRAHGFADGDVAGLRALAALGCRHRIAGGAG